MKNITVFLAMMLMACQVQAGLELKYTYQDWEHYEAETAIPGERVVIGVTEVKSKGQVTTVALRCTYEGINLLFFKSFDRTENGYSATSKIDSGKAFNMGVWLKGATHWATFPKNKLFEARNGKELTVELRGDERKELIIISLNGFDKMYSEISPTCK